MDVSAFAFFGDGPVGAFAVSVGSNTCDADLPGHLALGALRPAESVAVGGRDHIQVAVIAEIRVVSDGSDLLDGEIFIDKAVAIVVAVVAGFVLGQDIAETRAPLTDVARLDAITTIADLSGFGWPRVAIALEGFVCFAVAVVVEVVTQLFAGFLEALARPKASVGADAFAGSAYAGFARFTGFTDTFGAFGFFGRGSSRGISSGVGSIEAMGSSFGRCVGSCDIAM